MEATKQSKARKAEAVRTETLTFRLDKQLRALAEIAARNKVKLALCGKRIEASGGSGGPLRGFDCGEGGRAV